MPVHSKWNLKVLGILEHAFKSIEMMKSIHCPFMKTFRKERLLLVDDDIVAQRRVTRRAEWRLKTVCFTQSLLQACILLEASRKKRCSFLQRLCTASDSKLFYTSIELAIKRKKSSAGLASVFESFEEDCMIL